ncbi:MAG: hypothetical protein OK441_00640 [Thaumarchaeota archaeon]|nr:hypothetical protein [Nitrososphaerota archaeon]
MIRHERLIAVISSGDIRLGRGSGFALVVTDGRIVGTSRLESLGIPEPYLWVEGGSSETGRAAAQVEAARLIGRKKFELSKESIFKILYEAPGLFFGGRLIFESVGEEVRLDISVVSVRNPSGVLTVEKMIDALLIFAPDRLYDEKSGALVRDENPRR